MRADRAELIAHHPFPLDAFQTAALDVLDDGRSVLVAAPTGSGKTVVAEYAIAAALRDGLRAFYTAPIKALSNQKYQDLVARHGTERVGLLTGDNAINGDAPIVVMTTEVLRNMIYAQAPGLARLGIVVLDEVHFLQDTYRGPVWEEVIVHLDPAVRLVCLSATVSNAQEVADWITTVRGPTSAIVEERRPVRLEHLYMVGDRTYERLHLLPTLVDGRPNPEAGRLDDESLRRRGPRPARGRGQRRLFTPSRLEVVERLERERMLPAICFVFSRNQCDEAARTCLAAGVRLTTGDERERIRAIIDARLDALEPQDLAVLGYGQFRAQLEAGVAAHHAGMVPPFKEVVEACFVEGLTKVVFATETLAVGINMPARAVVIEKLTKFTGEHHAALTPGEYTQLTGRAGRRGIDDIGYALVLWSPFVGFDQVAALASSRAFHLESAFRPTYNMAANLVRRYSSERAHHLLDLSFAQYQADRMVVQVEARIERRRSHLEELRRQAHSDHGDIDEYRRAREEAARTPGRSDDIEQALAALRPGDIVYARKGRYSGRTAVLTTAQRKGGTRLTAISGRGRPLQLGAEDFDEAPRSLGRIELPPGFAPDRHDYQREVAARLGRAKLAPYRPPRRARATDAIGHPVEDDPDLARKLAAASSADRVARELDDLRRRAQGRSDSVGRSFDRVLSVLEHFGYVSGWSLTDRGRTLARTFHECDLLVAETTWSGLLDDVDPASLAGLVSMFVYEHRSPEPPPAAWYPSAAVRRRAERIEELSAQLAALEQSTGLPVHRAPDPTFLAIAHAWAAGEGFAEVVADEDISAGDFVRTMKQLVDLLRQLAAVAPRERTRASAQEAAERLLRGVVAASSAVADPAQGAEPEPAGEARP